eukprot:7762108-Pyramimonas_sp.AAC.3
MKFHEMRKKEFGRDAKLNIEQTFVHTGIRHRITEEGKCIILDQIDDAAAIKPLAATCFQKMSGTQPLTEELNACL